MATEGCILSGVDVLLFMARNELPDSRSLDIVVQWKNARNISNWLSQEAEPRYFLECDAKEEEGVYAAFSGYDRGGTDIVSRGLSDMAFTDRFGYCPTLNFRTRSNGTIIRVCLTRDTPVEKIISQSSSTL